MYTKNKFKSNMFNASIIIMTVILFCSPVRAEESHPATWQENTPIFTILYAYQTTDMFEMYYNGESVIDTDNFNRFEKIHMLMVNGGFVPHHNIIIKNNRTMVPVSIIEEVFGATVDYEEEGSHVKITVADTEIEFGISTGYAFINGKKQEQIEATPFFRDSKIYVPLRFVAEALGADTEYKKDLLFLFEKKMPSFRNEFYVDLEYFDIVVIETGTKDKEAFTVEEGIKALKEAAIEMYGESHIAQYISRDYDMHDIEYTNHDLGRYYVYVVKGFENEPVYFNKYTGEIFSSPGGSIPFFTIIKGFLNKPAN